MSHIDQANPRTVREAIDDVLAGGPGGMLEATRFMSVDQAHELATKILLQKGALERVSIHSKAGWFYVQPERFGAE